MVALIIGTAIVVSASRLWFQHRRPGIVALWTGGALVAMVILRLAGIGLLPPLLFIGSAMFASYYLLVRFNWSP